MKKPICIGIGEILWDVLPEGKKLGGAPANFAFHTRQFGAKSLIISSIGNDKDGNKIKQILKQCQLSELISTDPLHPTGKVSVTLDKKGTAKYIIHENAAWDYIGLNSEHLEIAKQTDAVCFGTLAQRNPVSANAIQSFLKHTSEKCMKIFDINLRQDYYSKIVIEHLMRWSTILKLNTEELNTIALLFDLPREETSCLRILKEEFSLDYVILTKGEHGSRIFKSIKKDSIFKHEKITVADSVGAGDSFTAAVTIGLLNHLDLDKIHETASQIAAFVCTKKGATPQIPQNLIQKLY